jgi:hypothetical protein
MSEWAAVNITKGATKNKTTVSLKHWWGVLEGILPIMASLKATKPTVKSMHDALLKVNKGRDWGTWFHRMDEEDITRDQQDWCAFSYDLYATKDGWEIEVWSNPGYPLTDAGVDIEEPTDRIVVVKRMPLTKITKKTLTAAQAAKKAEGDRVLALAATAGQ